MAHKTNNFERFWKELKRRKVIHVITIYAAIAFVILQVTNMVVRPLRLPDFTEALVIILLCIGFIISVLVSWIYDITPTGVKKTKPISAAKHIDKPTIPTSNVWKTATYVSGVIIIALIAFNINTRNRLNSDLSKLEKSVAVLPFRNDSPNDTNAYFIDGVMEKVLNNLQLVKELRVVSRTSVEQYRDATKSIPEIAKELGVNYIIEGSGQKYGNSFSVSVQLIKAAKEDHLWGKYYEQDIKEVKDILNIQNQIASTIVTELKVTITPEEKQLIEKPLTTNLTAYDFYQRGSEEYLKSWLNNNDKEALERAEDFFLEALDSDSTFAQAYVGLAWVYWQEHFWEAISSENLRDSVLVFCDRALLYDKQLPDAYTTKGDYYLELNKPYQAKEEYDKAIKLNPNDWKAYYGKGSLYFYSDYVDYVKSVENFQKAISLNHGSEMSGLLRKISSVYLKIGFFEKAKFCNQEALKLDKDSLNYYYWLSFIEGWNGNLAKGVELKEKMLAFDSNSADIYASIGQDYMFIRQPEQALKYYKEFLQKRPEARSEQDYFDMHRCAWAYMQNGDKKEAEYFLNKHINNLSQLQKTGQYYQQSRIYYDLAGAYALMGDRKKTYVNLQLFLETPDICNYLWTFMIKYDPLFDNVRNEPEFQLVAREIELKHQTEHERVRKWLEENNML